MTSDTAILNTLYSLNRSGRDKDALKILDQWYNLDTYSRSKIHDTLCLPDVDDVSEVINKENIKLFNECDVRGTPTFFINGYKLPDQYNIDDIKHFREVFIEKKKVEV